MSIRIYGATSGYVDLDAPAVAGSASVTLPGSGTLALYSQLKVLQVVRATDVTDRSSTSTSYADVTGMSVTITPQKSNSNILILAIFNFNSAYGSGTEGYGVFQITDSSNNAISGAEGTYIGRAVTAVATTNSLQASILSAWASPGSTSAVTYKMRFKSGAATTTVYVRNAYSTGQMYAIEVTA